MTRSSHPNSGQPGSRQLLRLLAASLLLPALVQDVPVTAQGAVEQQENQVIREFSLPEAAPEPVYQPAPEAPQPAYQPEPVYQPDPGPPAAPEPAPAEGAGPGSEPAPAPASEGTAPTDNSGSAPGAEPAGSAPRSSEPIGDALPAFSGPMSRYVMEFNRAPVVGNRFRLQGVFSEGRLGFTRPKSWKVRSVKAIIRYQHSPALRAANSSLTLRINGKSISAVPLARKPGQIGELLATIPGDVLQDFNEVILVANNNNAECSNPADPTLWTEVLPDSKLVFDYQPIAVPLDLKRFPEPFFDPLSLDANRIAYAMPTKASEGWLTATARFQAALGRLADYRPLDNRIVKTTTELSWNDRLVIIGTPAEQQGLLKTLKLPLPLKGDRWIDGSKTALPDDVGVVMIAPSPDGGKPILVVSGNGPEGVKKAVQSLTQPELRKTLTGQLSLVTTVTTPESAELRNWPRHLPTRSEFRLAELRGPDREPLKTDLTIHNASAPPIELDFRALPDDRFDRGSTFNLNYSYGPQLNTKTSTVEVAIDGVTIAGKRLDSEDGRNRENFPVTLPENQIRPNSKLRISFQLNPREAGKCGVVTDRQLWATVHTQESRFNLNRSSSVKLPDLKLLQVGYPFAEPQDLSRTAIVVPDNPGTEDLMVMLEASERLGRLSESAALQLVAYNGTALPEAVRTSHHLVGIGTRGKFPLADILNQGTFQLGKSSRQSQGSTVQSLPDRDGVIKSVLSPWNKDRIVLALTGQNDLGLAAVRGVLSEDSWFLQLKGDTVLVSTKKANVPAFDPNAFELEFLQEAPSKRFENTGPLEKAKRFTQENWYILPPGVVGASLLLYGISQMYINRRAEAQK
jgi:cellulose synthase operon protein B